MERDVIKEMIMASKAKIVEQYENPEVRDWHWDIMKDWIVDHEGNLTKRGESIVNEVHEWKKEREPDGKEGDKK